MGNKEVRDILLGRIVRQDEKFWTVAPADVRLHFHGLRDGAGDVHLFGVTHLTRRYRTAEMERDDALDMAEKALYSMGTPLRFSTMQECKGCLYAPHWIAPVLLTVAWDADGLKTTAYTGRSLLFSRIRCRIAMWILEQRLPESVTRAGKSKKTDRGQAKREKFAFAGREKMPMGEQALKREKSAKSGGKREGPTKKKTAPPKRLMK